MKPVRWSRTSISAEHLVVGLLCILFAFSLGAHYGVSDQNVYMPSGLRLADPSFLERDWYISKTAQHNIAFNYLVYALQGIGPLAWTSAVLYLLLKALVAVSAYVMLRALYDRPLLPFLLSMPLLHLAVGAPRLLSHPFFVPWLIPAGIASALFLIGVASLSVATPERLSRYVLSGVLFGLSGLIHGTFLFLIPLFLAGIWVALPRRFSFREIAAFGIPFLALTLPIGWMVYARFDFGENGLDRLDALLRLRVPHHHLPRTWGVAGFALFAKHATLGIIGLLMMWPNTSRASVVLAATASLWGLFAFVVFCTAVIFVPQVAMLQAFHLLSLLSYFNLLFFAGAVAQEVESAPEPFSTHRLKRLILLGIGLVVVYLTNWAIAIVMTALISFCLIRARSGLSVQAYSQFARRLLVYKAVLFLSGLAGFCLPLSTAFFVPYEAESDLFRWIRVATPKNAQATLMPSRAEPDLFGWVRAATPKNILAVLMPSRAESDLFRWIRATTPKDALFVVPLEMERFRLHAGRSIVVDWKGFPYRTKDAEEWYRRTVLVSDVTNPKSKQEALLGYLNLNSERAQALAREFGAQYVVVRTDRHLGDLSELKKVYVNDEYAVYSIDGGIAN